jgi:hypothetical protein
MSLGPTPLFDLSPSNGVFMQGRPPSGQNYHNIGQLRTPYLGKNANFKSAQGDYGPPQRTRYYTLQNPLAPYPMMSRWQASQYLPTLPCAFGVPGQYPTVDYTNPDTEFVPPNYFDPSYKPPTGEYPYPSQTFGKTLIRNITTPVPEDITVQHAFRENYTPSMEKVRYDSNQYGGNYVKLVDTYAPLLKNMPVYKDGEKYSI